MNEYKVTNVNVSWFALWGCFLHSIASTDEVLMCCFEDSAMIIE